MHSQEQVQRQSLNQNQDEVMVSMYHYNMYHFIHR